MTPADIGKRGYIRGNHGITLWNPLEPSGITPYPRNTLWYCTVQYQRTSEGTSRHGIAKRASLLDRGKLGWAVGVVEKSRKHFDLFGKRGGTVPIKNETILGTLQKLTRELKSIPYFSPG